MNSSNLINPFVTIIVPMFNEQKYIENCLASILELDYPSEKLQILIVDGQSTDDSVAIVQRYCSANSNIEILKNPARIQSAAMNIGLKESRGEYIIRMDAHTLYAKDYVSKCIEALIRTNAANVGGKQTPVGRNYLTKTIALSTSCKFGVGDAKFRYSDKSQYVDTVYLGAWPKKVLIDINGFNEEWKINEDYELNYRLRKKGLKILLDPSIKCQYYVRATLRSFIRQYFRYGFWKTKTLFEHPGSLKLRQIIPPLMVASLIISLAIIPFNLLLGLIIPLIYFGSDLMFSLKVAIINGLRYFFCLVLIFPLMHFSWGAGFWLGLLDNCWKFRKR